MALDVGKIFYSDKNVVAYNRLGIGRFNISASTSTLSDVHKRDI